MNGGWAQGLRARFDTAMAVAGVAFMEAWAVVERAYRRPLGWLARRLRFAFYPLLAIAMLGWLAWDAGHGRSLAAAEDAVFDQVIGWRPVEPVPSGRTVVVAIDDCSIDYVRALGGGGWPWSRERHADLLDALDRAGVRAVGIDILFADRSPTDPGGDALLEAMADAGAGRFVFAASRLHADADASSSLHAARVPGAFPLASGAAPPGPTVALLQPYGQAMARHSGLVNIERGRDGLLRDVPLYQRVGDWALPGLALRVAQAAGADTTAAVAGQGGALRIDWRQRSPLPYASAADILEGAPVCGEAIPPLDGAVVLVGHAAAGINDSKPTPVDMAMPGVVVLAEAVEALVHGRWIRMPPGWLKYALAGFLVLLSCLVFWRGEPHQDVDPLFVGLNLVLLAVAFLGLTFLGWFVDIFASLGYGALCFGLCRGYAAVQRAHAAGNADYRPDYDPDAHPWVLACRLRFEADASLPQAVAMRARREYRRRLRRSMHASGHVVMIEGAVERKHWMTALLDDLVLLSWTAGSEAEVRARAKRDLDAFHAALNDGGERLDGRARVLACVDVAPVGAPEGGRRGRRQRLRALLNQDFERLPHWPLSADNAMLATAPHAHEEGTPCEAPSTP